MKLLIIALVMAMGAGILGCSSAEGTQHDVQEPTRPGQIDPLNVQATRFYRPPPTVTPMPTPTATAVNPTLTWREEALQTCITALAIAAVEHDHSAFSAGTGAYGEDVTVSPPRLSTGSFGSVASLMNELCGPFLDTELISGS